MLLFGKILEALAAPSDLIEQFMADSLRVLTFPDGRTPGNAGVVSVSLHVRQGDSCEFMLDKEDRNTTTYLVGRKRPCFSIEVYMRALHKIRAMYNVSK
eukprot:gene68102-93305_t